MIKVRDQEKFEFASVLFMNGMPQKEIAKKVGITAATLSKWVESYGWREKRAAKTVTRKELVNKLLQRIATLLDDPEAKGLEDSLAKLSKAISTLDKQVNIVYIVECFIALSAWLDSRDDLKKFITDNLANESDRYTAFIKTLNRVQDMFVSERLGARSI